MKTPFWFVFDVESIGLHGEAFAVGWVVVDSSGTELESGMLCADRDRSTGSAEDREWVAKNVPDLDTPPVESTWAMRSLFWTEWLSWRELGAMAAADVPWPVEAGLLSACVADFGDQWKAPYPLIDIASVRLAKGLDPLGAEDRREDEPAHHPLGDARQSARLLIEALAHEYVAE